MVKVTIIVCDFCGSDSSDMGKHPDGRDECWMCEEMREEESS